jgi:hypothetical protein
MLHTGIAQSANLLATGRARLQWYAACAAAQDAERVGAPIPNHKFESSLPTGTQ